MASTTTGKRASAGWYRDPSGRYEQRWWDGATWTGHVRGQLALSAATLAPSPVSRLPEAPTDPYGITPPTSSPPRPPAPSSTVVPNDAGLSLLRWSTPVLACVYGGAALVAVGAFLPWVKASAGAFSATQSGTEGDGVITLLLAVVVAISFSLIKSRGAAGITTMCLGAAIGVIAAYDLFDISSKAEGISTGLDVSASPQIGLILTGLAALAIVVGAALALGEAAPADVEERGAVIEPRNRAPLARPSAG
jgi:hypothetical protein